MDKLNRRKNYFIKKAFQTHFSLRFAALIILAAGLVTGIFLYASSGTLTTGYMGSELRIEKTSAFFSPTLLWTSALVALGVGLAGLIVFIIYSHRLAGPLYRVEKALHEIGQGDLTHRIKLRKNDQLEDLAQSLNRFAQRMDDKLGVLRRELDQVGAQFPDASKPGDMTKLVDTINRLKEVTDTFKTTK